MGKNAALRSEETDFGRALRRVATRRARACDRGLPRILRPGHAPFVARLRIDDRAPRFQSAYIAQPPQQTLRDFASRSELVGLFKFPDSLMCRRAHRPIERTWIKVKLVEPLPNFMERCGITEFEPVIGFLDSC